MKKQLLIAMLALATTINAQEVEEVSVDSVEAVEVGEGSDVSSITVVSEPAKPSTAVSAYVDAVGYTISDGEKLYASPMARFEVQGVDEQSGLKEILVSIDGGVYAPYKDSISFSTEGEHSLNYQFIDRVGNVSYSKVFSVTIDATAPRVLELEVTPKPHYISGVDYVGPSSEITFRAHDDLTGLAYVEFGTDELTKYETNTSFADLGFTSTGKAQILYQATDMVSNVSPVKSHVFSVDATAPTVDVFAKAVEVDGVRYISSRDTIFVEAHDNETMVSEILFAINEGDFQVYDSEIGINIKRAGEYTVLAKAIDIVGNESDVVEYKVVIDMLAPTGEAAYIGEELSSSYDPLATNEVVAEEVEEVVAVDVVEEPASDEVSEDVVVVE